MLLETKENHPRVDAMDAKHLISILTAPSILANVPRIRMVVAEREQSQREGLQNYKHQREAGQRETRGKH
jgi:hypothetical protein